MGSPDQRDPAFRELCVIDDDGRATVAYELTPESPIDPELARSWRDLPPSPYLFEPLGSSAAFHLRFVAIDWPASHLRLRVDGPAATRVANAGVAITRAFELIAAFVSPDRLGWFTSPFVRFDLEGRPRVGFHSPQASVDTAKLLAPEVIDRFPFADEASLVYAVGQLLLGRVMLERATLATPLGRVIRRALMTDPGRRYSTLRALRDAFVQAGARSTTPHGALGAWVWEQIDNGVGFLVVKRWSDALARFDAAQRLCVGTPQILDTARRYALARGAVPREEATIIVSPELSRSAGPKTALTAGIEVEMRSADWRRIEPEALRLEAAGEPLAAYARAPAKPAAAIGHAKRALAIDPSSRPALQIATSGHSRRHEHAAALTCVERWRELAPDEPAMHYARGKVLLNLRRLPEAYAAFDRATVLDPHMLEAMLLRREVDRMARRARLAVGAQTQAVPDLPVALREALLGGRPQEALELLEGPAYAADVLAQLIRAELLADARRFEDALAVFQRFTHDPAQRAVALIGVARMLLELERAEAALVAVDHLAGVSPGELEVLELKARALEQLGRGDEAAAERARLAEQTAIRSQARISQTR
ncbi:MAG: hypothetical protein IPQ07_20385 [Myxococcales bacterium]|nr:hypothetical protein [Myxococcales bacterium]